MAGFQFGMAVLDSELFMTSAGENNNVELSGSLLYVITSNSGDSITGLAIGQNIGALIFLVNIEVSTYPLIIKNDDASSDAENRILTFNGEDAVIYPQESAVLGYDTTSQRWHILKVFDVAPANYLVIHDETTQNIVTPGTFQVMTFSENDILNGWTHTAGSDVMVCPRTGLYQTSGFAQMNKTAGAASLFEFRLTVNGTPVGQVSASTLNTNNEVKSLARSRLALFNKDDEIRIEWTAGTNSQLIVPPSVGAGLSVSFSIHLIKG